jgi:hypothetical protein
MPVTSDDQAYIPAFFSSAKAIGMQEKIEVWLQR